MSAQRVPTSMYCRQCNYELLMLSEPRCPECGTPFDPADDRSFLHHPREWYCLRWWRRAKWALAIIAVGVLLYTCVLWTYLRFYWYRGQQAEQPHVAVLTDLGCHRLSRGAGYWARDLAKPFGWYYMTERVKDLRQGGQPLTAEDLQHVGALEYLESLRLGPAPFDPAGLVYIENLPNLVALEIQGPRNHPAAVDAQMTHLAKMKQLQYLALANTDVSDKGLAWIGRLPQLRQLSLHGTAVTPQGIQRLRQQYPQLRIFGP